MNKNWRVGFEDGRKELLRLVEANLLFPFEGSLVSGKEIERPRIISMQRTAFNKIFRECANNGDEE